MKETLEKLDDKMLIKFRQDSRNYAKNVKSMQTHKIGKCGAVMLASKNGDICAECRKEVKKEFTGINPLKQRVYKRLEKMKLKDLADKINELAEKLSTQN